ncbi:hypothetical protein V1477_002526, partial [Vespula maculifrons]
NLVDVLHTLVVLRNKHIRKYSASVGKERSKIDPVGRRWCVVARRGTMLDLKMAQDQNVRDLAKAYLLRVSSAAGTSRRNGKREEKSGEELLYDTDLASSFASAIPSGLGVPGIYSTYKIRCWWCVGVGDGDACSGRCGFRRVTTLGYGVSRWPSVEGAPRGLIEAPRIDPIT